MRPAVLAALVVFGSLLLVRCTTPAATMRVRMTVELDTPTGLKSGSSVMQLTLARKFLIPLPGAGGSDYGGRWWLHGEAPYVAMGRNAVLFTMRRSDRGDRRLDSAILNCTGVYDRRNTRPSPGDEAIVRTLNGLNQTTELSSSNYPMFATVGEPRTRNSVTEVPADELWSVLGSGYAVKRIACQVVDKKTPLTTSLRTRFPDVAKIQDLFVEPE